MERMRKQAQLGPREPGAAAGTGLGHRGELELQPRDCLAEEAEVGPHGEDPARLLEHVSGGFPVSQRHVGVCELDARLDREPGRA